MTHDARREAAYARCLHDRVPNPVAEVPSVTGPPCGAVNTRASRGRADISTDMPSRVWETSLKAGRLIISTTSTYRWSIICSSVSSPARGSGTARASGTGCAECSARTGSADWNRTRRRGPRPSVSEGRLPPERGRGGGGGMSRSKVRDIGLLASEIGPAPRLEDDLLSDCDGNNSLYDSQ